jgi:hypothetical protein
MTRIALTCSILLVGLLLYWAGNRIFGHYNRGGYRLIAFVTGIASITFGTSILLELIHGEQNTDRGIYILCPIFGLLGVYLIFMSVTANNKKIEKVVDDMTRGI